jgi:hypothetical protein
VRRWPASPPASHCLCSACGVRDVDDCDPDATLLLRRGRAGEQRAEVGVNGGPRPWDIRRW